MIQSIITLGWVAVSNETNTEFSQRWDVQGW